MIKTDVLIIGAGPTGLFCAHQLGIIGLTCEIVDNLDKAGGQCIELYPDKPIYDIPAVPECTGEELTNNLLKQIKPFKVNFHLNQRVEELKKFENRWHVKTNSNKEFDSKNEISDMVGSIPKQVQQFYVEIPSQYRLIYLLSFLYAHQHEKVIVFVSNCELANFLQ